MTTLPIGGGEQSRGIKFRPNPEVEHDIEFPLTKNPIRFAVIRRDGLSSNAWRVWVEDPGDIYIVCRDHMKEIKISLHQSGQHRIAFTTESKLEMTEGNRLWGQWDEPDSPNSPKVVPSFDLFFPSWALCLTQDIREADAKVWNKNQIFVEAAESPVATAISFVITDELSTVQFSTDGDSPSVSLGVLPARSGKKLWVIARHTPEGNMTELAGQGISGFESSIVDTSSIVDRLRGLPSGSTLGMCVAGHRPTGGGFLMPYVAEMHWKGTDGTTAN